MPRRNWPIISISICFLCLAAYIVLNDVNYRRESAYRDIQIQTFAVYSDWNIYIGTLRGLLLTTNGFGQTLDDAAYRKMKTETRIADLRRNSLKMDPEIRETLNAFIGSIEAGLKLGQELQDNGALFLRQPDLPRVYREGRVGLYALTGKDATAQMGKLSAFQYYQLVRRLKGLNVLFDQLYSDRLDTFLQTIADRSERMRRNFFIIRLIFLSITFGVIVFTIVRLYGMNRFLRKLADRTSEELQTTRSHLNEVQDFLQSARFQQSLFEMVAGISHELNTPLGNSMSVTTHLEELSGEMAQAMDRGALTRERFDEILTDHQEGFQLIRSSLEQMKTQIDTFKRLSAVNHEEGGALIPLNDYVDREVARLVAETAPELEVSVNWSRQKDVSIRYMYLDQILSQLLKNSLEHAQAQKVSIRFEVEGETLVIHFSDNGIGVTDEQLSRLAEPFFTTARGQSHMGLGLSIIASLVSNRFQGHVDFLRGDPGLVIRITIHLDNIR